MRTNDARPRLRSVGLAAAVLVGITVLVAVVRSPRPALSAAAARDSEIAATIRHLEALGNRTTREKQWEAARWIASRLANLGLATELQEYSRDGESWPNVTASIPGTASPHEIVLVIAHLDSVSSDDLASAPGADDDASGVAVLLDVAARVAGAPQPRTIQFGVFGDEERGHAGSGHFARWARAAGVQLRAVINLDTLGYPPPSAPIDWDGLRGLGASWRAVEALETMLRNYASSARSPSGGVQVAGRPADAALVAEVAAALRPHVEAREIVKDDSG